MAGETENKIYEMHGNVEAIRAIVERTEGDLRRIEADLRSRPCVEHGKLITELKVRSGIIGALAGAIAAALTWLSSNPK